MMLKKTIIISSCILATQLFMSQGFAKVQKCQDADGKWHYGNDLSGVCQNEAEIQSVVETVKAGSSSQVGSDDQLKQLEIKLLDQNEYLTSDLETALAPYNSVQDVETRFDQLKTQTTAELNEKETVLEGLQKKHALLLTEKETNTANADVLIADSELRIQNTEDEIEELTAELAQIEKRRAKMLTIFNQFSDKFGNDQVRQQG